MEEVWKDITGYEGLYQVSNLGRIKSLERKDKFIRLGKEICRKRDEKILSQKITRCGYKIVHLMDYSKNIDKWYSVHRLVANEFLENNLNKPQVNHKDGNKENNNINNLEWTTASENKKHAWANGLANSKRDCLGRFI